MFFCCFLASLFVFSKFLGMLFMESLHDPINNYILVIPLISLFFLYLKRNEIFTANEYALWSGSGIIIVGLALYAAGLYQNNDVTQLNDLSMIIFSIVIMWIGGFTFFYGVSALKHALFPALFLLLAIPIPSVLLEKAILLLQEGSADVAHVLFKVVDVPVLRQGFVFKLSRLSIEVAKQCSGIHSAIALVITGIIAGKLFLVTGWKRWILVLVAVPIAIFKNGLRIATLTLLGNYVDERILGSSLHRDGGIPFFLLGVAFLTVVLWLFRKTEAATGPLTDMRRPTMAPEMGDRKCV